MATALTTKDPIERLRQWSDAELVEASRRQEPGAYGELFRRWHDRSYDVALNILRDRDSAADVAQEALIIGWERLADLREPGAFGGWLLRSTRNRALNRATRDKFRGMSQLDAFPEWPVLRDPDADPAIHVERADRRRLVWTAVGALGERDTSLLDLHLRHGLGPTEIAEELQITPNNAKQLLFQLRRKLREAIGAVLLWRDGQPTCDILADLVAESGSFNRQVARTIRNHHRECRRCQRELAQQTSPERLFASVPLAVAPLIVKEQAAAGLVQAGIPAVQATATSTLAGTTGALGVLPGMPVSAGAVGIAGVAGAMVLAIALSPVWPGTDRSPRAEAGGSAILSTTSGPGLASAPTPAGVGNLAASAGTTPGSAAAKSRPTALPPSARGRAVAAPSPGSPAPYCRYVFDASPGGNGQFTGQFVLTNESSSPWHGWGGAFAVAAPLTVSNSWGGEFWVSGTSVTLTPADYTSSVQPGASVVIGLSGTTPSSIPRVSDVTVQGHACRTA